MGILMDSRTMGFGSFRLYYPYSTLIHMKRIVCLTLGGLTLDADILSGHLLISKRHKRYYKVYINVKPESSSSIVAANTLLERDSKSATLKIITNDTVINLSDFVEFFDVGEREYRYYFKKREET